MLNRLKIEDVNAREILDSRGNPTVEAAVTLKCGLSSRASVPSGASVGKFEAAELRDGEENRYMGKGVKMAVNHVNTAIKHAISGMNVLDQELIDQKMREADGSENKGNLGANAILSVSLACARTAAKALDIPLFRYLGGCEAHIMPVPMMNIINGGCHADNTLDFQEFMIMPVGAQTFEEGLRMGSEVYHCLKSILKSEGLSVSVGDEGGFAPDIKDTEQVFEYLGEAVKKNGLIVGKDIAFAMDAAASGLYDEESGSYHFPGESRVKGESVSRTSIQMVELYDGLTEKFPIISIEDGLDEEDWQGWKLLSKVLGERIQLVGDDLFVTNTERLGRGIEQRIANAILIKVNQIGTLSEAADAVRMAQKHGYRAIISHRSGETGDAFIADLAVALGAGQIKTGAPCRSDRLAKYNQLLRIGDQLKKAAVYVNPFETGY